MKIVKFFFFCFLVIFPFGQLGRISLSTLGLPEVRLHLLDLSLLCLISSWLIAKLVQKKKILLGPLFQPVLIFLFIASLSLLLNSNQFSDIEFIVASLYLFRWALYFGLYVVAFDFKKELKEFSTTFLSKVFVGWGVFTALFGFVQLFLWPNLKMLEVWSWDPHNFRLVSTFLDPGFTGIILVLTLLMLVGKRNLFLKNNDKFGWLLLAVTYLGLALTYSRSSYLAFLAGTFALAWMKNSFKIFIIAFLAIMATVLVLPRPSGEGGKITRWYSVSARIENWENSLVIAADHPLLGVGFNTYRYVQRDYGFLSESDWRLNHAGAGADSSLLFVLATTGTLGFLSYLRIGAKAIGPLKNTRKKGRLLIPCLLAVFCHSFFLNSFFYPWVMTWLWLLLVTDGKIN